MQAQLATCSPLLQASIAEPDMGVCCEVSTCAQSSPWQPEESLTRCAAVITSIGKGRTRPWQGAITLFDYV